MFSYERICVSHRRSECFPQMKMIYLAIERGLLVWQMASVIAWATSPPEGTGARGAIAMVQIGAFTRSSWGCQVKIHGTTS